MSQERFTDLRRKAEALMLAKSTNISSLTRADLESLAHELAVHKVELEIQNEELRQTRIEIEEARDRFLDVFEFAPVSYFILDEHNRVIEVNLTGCQLLKMDKINLVKSSFTQFISPEESESLYLKRRKVMESGNRQTWEMQMQKADGAQFFARIESIRVGEGRLRLAVMDVTERRAIEIELTRIKNDLEAKVKERTLKLSEANHQLKQYGRKITHVQEEERKRIAYELHDDTAQYLSILKLQLEGLLLSGKIKDPEVIEKLNYLANDADRAFNDVRRYSHELRPGVLDHLGLHAALEQISEDINKLKQFKIELLVDGKEPKLSDEVKLGLFRITQEAINNIRKHAKATNATIFLNFYDNQVKLIVIDNGTGFNLEEVRVRTGSEGSLGLMSMAERAKLIGADLEIESEQGKGTTITAEISL